VPTYGAMMNETLVLVGVACVLGAIVGGGLSAFGIALPLISSIARQVGLAMAGLALIAWGTFMTPRGEGTSAPPTAATPAPVTPPTPSGSGVPKASGGPFSAFGDAKIFLSKESGVAGTQLTVSGTGFGAEETVVIRFSTREVGRPTTDGHGNFANVVVRIPPDWLFKKQVHFVATGQASGFSATMPFQVL
jgi:hypothetical protein